MVIALCLDRREVSFAVGPRDCGGSEWWFDVGAETGALRHELRCVRLRLWLHIGPWWWAWIWEKARGTIETPWCDFWLRNAIQRSIIRELETPNFFARFLPRHESHYEVIHGEVIKITERIEPETTGGDQISIEGIPHVYPAGGIEVSPSVVSPARVRWLQAWVNWAHDAEVQRICDMIRGDRPATEGNESLPASGLTMDEELRSLVHRHIAEAQARAEPPTSACSRCGRTFPVADLYTGQKTRRQVCDTCLTAMVAAGTATRPAEF